MTSDVPMSLVYANPTISVTPDREPSPATKKVLEDKTSEGMNDYEPIEILHPIGGACNTKESESNV